MPDPFSGSHDNVENALIAGCYATTTGVIDDTVTDTEVIALEFLGCESVLDDHATAIQWDQPVGIGTFR